LTRYSVRYSQANDPAALTSCPSSSAFSQVGAVRSTKLLRSESLLGTYYAGRVPRPPTSPDPSCAVSAAASVLADRWCWLVVRDVARGHRRFDDLVAELGISRKVLAERLRHLLEQGVLEQVAYQDNPIRHDYVLTGRG